eukprot:TRINITY_DN11972_c0_g3_i4.p1 TRINITY_DN11972_c0_g3~~TRINITY_DN11972_c0_g3_i4.p1  ORF type:complete len:367 (-),score=65.55 TRINITY_DN11972_c0_g3_i4:1785-2885(-)
MAVGSRTTLRQQRRNRSRRQTPQNAQDLYQRGMYSMDIQDYGNAERYFEMAAGLAPNNHKIVEAYGSLLAEMGKADKATEVLTKAVELSPDQGFEKYMYLGQLLEGEAGILHVRKGIDIIKGMISQANHSEQVELLRNAYSSALCALAEQLMQLAQDKEVDDNGQIDAVITMECEKVLNEARNADSNSPEPVQALASLRYECGMPEEALTLLRESMSKWFKPRKQITAYNEMPGDGDGVQMDENADAHTQKAKDKEEEDDEEEEYVEQPAYEFRFECAKLLLELEENTDTAIEVLEQLLEEDDRIPHVWQLLAMSYYGGNKMEEAEEIANQAIEIIKAQGATSDDDAIICLEELKTAINEAKNEKQ